MPLTYVLRPDAEVTQKALDTGYDDIDTDLYHTARLDDDVFKTNNAKVYQLLKNVIFDGPGRYITKKNDTSMNGRASFLDIKRQAEGTAVPTTKKARAYKSIAAATSSQRYTFDKYLETHQKAHVTLADLGEPIAESKNVDDFLKGITDPRLTTNKQIIDSDQTKLNNFEACAQYLKTSVLRTTIRNPDNRHIAAFMMQNQGGDNSDNRRDRSNKRNPNDNNRRNPNKKKQRNQPPRNQPRVHGGHYEPNEWNQLTNDEKAKVQRLRTVKKQQRIPGRNIGEVTPQPPPPPVTPAAATISSISVAPTATTATPVVFGALWRNVPHWVPTAKLATLAAPKPPPNSSTSSVTTTLTDATIASDIPPPAPTTTVSIASVSTSIPDPSLDDPFLIDRTGSPVQEGIEEHRRHIGTLLQQINTIEEEYEQYPETESDDDEEMERQDHIYFSMNERERVSLRRRIALLKQQIKDATALFTAKQAP
jgi:hypothetical protein